MKFSGSNLLGKEREDYCRVINQGEMFQKYRLAVHKTPATSLDHPNHCDLTPMGDGGGKKT